MEGVIGYVTGFAGNFAPRGWAMCQGQIMAIAQNTALFSILGTTYGGNGQTTFALPDLRGRTAIGAGQGPGLSPYSLGQVGGAETGTMNLNTMPGHTHPAVIKITPNANTTTDSNVPTASVYATPITSEQVYSGGFTGAMKTYPGTIVTGNSPGSSQPFSTLHPVMALNYLVCMSGVFPARN